MASEEEEGGFAGQEELDRLPCPGRCPAGKRLNAMSVTGSLSPVRLLRLLDATGSRPLQMRWQVPLQRTLKALQPLCIRPG